MFLYFGVPVPKNPLFQAFIPNGETCLIKVENLHLGFTAIDENVQVAVKWIGIKAVFDQSG